MKIVKVGIVLAILAAFMAGCAGVTINTTEDTNEILTEGIARRVSYHVALEYPEMIKPGLAVCEGVLGSDIDSDPNEAVAQVVMYLSDKLNDPLLKDDLNDLMRLMQFQVAMEEEDAAKLRYVMAAARGIKRGLEAAQEKIMDMEV